MSNNISFIEVKKVWAEKGNPVNVGTKTMTINIADIKSFRKWTKSKNDINIEGDMTQLILKKEPFIEVSRAIDGSSFSENVSSPGILSILIEESYSDFKYRLSQRVEVKALVQG